jgi:hypothetical protein
LLRSISRDQWRQSLFLMLLFLRRSKKGDNPLIAL